MQFYVHKQSLSGPMVMYINIFSTSRVTIPSSRLMLRCIMNAKSKTIITPIALVSRF